MSLNLQEIFLQVHPSLESHHNPDGMSIFTIIQRNPEKSLRYVEKLLGLCIQEYPSSYGKIYTISNNFEILKGSSLWGRVLCPTSRKDTPNNMLDQVTGRVGGGVHDVIGIIWYISQTPLRRHGTVEYYTQLQHEFILMYNQAYRGNAFIGCVVEDMCLVDEFRKHGTIVRTQNNKFFKL